MSDTYWQIRVLRQKYQSVYASYIPITSVLFNDADVIKIVRITKRNFEFIEEDFTRYIIVFQQRWREWHRMRKKFFKYLRLREIGIQYPLR
jgi:hypothetical protein